MQCINLNNAYTSVVLFSALNPLISKPDFNDNCSSSPVFCKTLLNFLDFSTVICFVFPQLLLSLYKTSFTVVSFQLLFSVYDRVSFVGHFPKAMYETHALDHGNYCSNFDLSSSSKVSQQHPVTGGTNQLFSFIPIFHMMRFHIHSGSLNSSRYLVFHLGIFSSWVHDRVVSRCLTVPLCLYQ